MYLTLAEWKKVKVKVNDIGETNSSMCECLGRSLLHIGLEEGLDLVTYFIHFAKWGGSSILDFFFKFGTMLDIALYFDTTYRALDKREYLPI